MVTRFYNQLRFLIILPLFTVVLGCATTQFMPVHTQDAEPIPNSEKLTAQKQGLIINAGPVSTPSGLRSKITTIELDLINPNDYEITFYPKSFVMFDHTDRQYYPLTKNALAEAAISNISYTPYYHRGWGFHHHYYHYYYGWGPAYFPSHYSGRSYQGLIAKALPLRPITIYPHSRVSGLLYYPVARNDLQSFRLRISRFTEKPTGPQDEPPSIDYHFEFEALK